MGSQSIVLAHVPIYPFGRPTRVSIIITTIALAIMYTYYRRAECFVYLLSEKFCAKPTTLDVP